MLLPSFVPPPRHPMRYEQLSTTLKAELAVEALHKALEQRRPPAGLMHHSDQGVQYASRAYVARAGGSPPAAKVCKGEYEQPLRRQYSYIAIM